MSAYISREDVQLLRRYARRNGRYPLSSAETQLCAQLMRDMSNAQYLMMRACYGRPGKDSLEGHHFDRLAYRFLGVQKKRILGPQGYLP